jgi:hypothetical protein
MKRTIINELIDYRDAECCATCYHFNPDRCEKFEIEVAETSICDHYTDNFDEGDNDTNI